MDRQYVGIDFHRRRSVIVRKNARQALQARCLNELVLDIAPVVLRDGERIFDDVPEFDAEIVEAATSPLATHIVYKINYSDSPD